MPLSIMSRAASLRSARTTRQQLRRPLAEDNTIDRPITYQPTFDEICAMWAHAIHLFGTDRHIAAAALFRRLSTVTNHELLTTLLLINAGLVHAHVGNFDVARRFFVRASQSGALNILTSYLLGVVAFESGNYPDSYRAFRACCELLEASPVRVSFESLGLLFSLDIARVNYNVDIARHEDAVKCLPPHVRPPRRRLPFSLPHRMLFDAPCTVYLPDNVPSLMSSRFSTYSALPMWKVVACRTMSTRQILKGREAATAGLDWMRRLGPEIGRRLGCRTKETDHELLLQSPRMVHEK